MRKREKDVTAYSSIRITRDDLGRLTRAVLEESNRRGKRIAVHDYVHEILEHWFKRMNLEK